MGLTLNGRKVLDRTLLHAQEFVLDADGDSSLTADTDDQLDLRLGGTDIYVFKTTGLDIGAVTNAILVSGTTTSTFKIDADATTGLEITSNCTPTDGILIAGAAADAIHISGAFTTSGINISDVTAMEGDAEAGVKIGSWGSPLNSIAAMTDNIRLYQGSLQVVDGPASGYKEATIFSGELQTDGANDLDYVDFSAIHTKTTIDKKLGWCYGAQHDVFKSGNDAIDDCYAVTAYLTTTGGPTFTAGRFAPICSMLSASGGNPSITGDVFGLWVAIRGQARADAAMRIHTQSATQCTDGISFDHNSSTAMTVGINFGTTGTFTTGIDLTNVCTTGIDIGACTTGVSFTGTTTDAIKIDADATTAINITSNCSPTNALLISGVTTSAIKIDADATTAIEITSNCSPTDGIIIASSTARGINISGAASSAQLYIGGTDILANGEQAIYVNCPSEDGATNAAWLTLGSTVTSGDVTGLRSRVTGNAASGGANIRGAYSEAFCGASKHVATLQGILAHASVAAGTCTVATTQVIYGIFATGDSFTGTDVYVGYLKAQTRGTETIGGNYCLLGLENEAVGGVGKQMDSAIRIFATNVSTPYAFGYGIDLSGAAGEIATADIKLSDGSVINDSNGYWGIGTASPLNPLTIKGLTTAANNYLAVLNVGGQTVLQTSEQATMQFGHSDTALGYGFASYGFAAAVDSPFLTIGFVPRLNDDSASHNAAQIVIQKTSGADSTYIKFETHNGTSRAERMRLHSNGNVGIGETVPVTALHIASDTGITMGSGSDADQDLLTLDITGSPKLWWDDDMWVDGMLTFDAYNSGSDSTGTSFAVGAYGVDFRRIEGQATARWFNDNTSPDAGNRAGQFEFKGYNDNNEQLSYANIKVYMDSITDGSERGRIEFEVREAAAKVSVLNVLGNGNVGIGISVSLLGKLHIDQFSTTAAIPPLVLDQADLSEEFIKFITTIGVGGPIEAVDGKTLTTTHFIRVEIPGPAYVYIPVGTIA